MNNTFPKRVVFLFWSCMSLAGCSKSPIARPPLRDVGSNEFAQLHALDGRWVGGRGSGGEVREPPYFEEYVWTDDSTIVIRKARDRLPVHLRIGAITLRNGSIRYQRGETLLAATELGAHGATFLPANGVAGGLTYFAGNGELVITGHRAPLRGYAWRDTVRVLKRASN